MSKKNRHATWKSRHVIIQQRGPAHKQDCCRARAAFHAHTLCGERMTCRLCSRFSYTGGGVGGYCFAKSHARDEAATVCGRFDAVA
jgi:hypothetical protein